MAIGTDSIASLMPFAWNGDDALVWLANLTKE